MKSSIIFALNAALAAATALDQSSAEGVHHKSTIQKQHGDSFYARPVEGYPVENSLALTSEFIYGHKGTGKSVHMGQFEVDVLWLYILGALIVIGVVVGAIICCCSGDKPPADKNAMMMDGEKDKMDMEKDNMMMGEGDMMMGGDMMAAPMEGVMEGM